MEVEFSSVQQRKKIERLGLILNIVAGGLHCEDFLTGKGGLGLAGARWGICKLMLGGPNETYAVQLGIWVQNQHLF